MFQVVFAYDVLPHVGITEESAWSRNMPRDGLSHQFLDAAMALLLVDRQTIAAADHRLQQGMWVDGIGFVQCRQSADPAEMIDETNAREQDPTRRIRGSYNRINQVSVCFNHCGKTAVDERSQEERDQHLPWHGRVVQDDYRPHILVVLYTGIITEDPAATWPISKPRLL